MRSPQKQVRIVLMLAFMASVVVHGMLVMITPRQTATTPAGIVEAVRVACYTVAAAGLLTSIYWAHVKMPVAINPLRFQTEMILAVAFAELCSVAGLFLFFVGHNPNEFWPFGSAALLVQGLFILPRVLQRD